jgi:hypothetical protein
MTTRRLIATEGESVAYCFSRILLCLVLGILIWELLQTELA